MQGSYTNHTLQRAPDARMHPGFFCQTFRPKRLLFVLVETFFLSKGGLYLLLLFVALLRGRSLTLLDQMMDVAFEIRLAGRTFFLLFHKAVVFVSIGWQQITGRIAAARTDQRSNRSGESLKRNVRSA